MYKTRSEKLTALQNFMNLETGELYEDLFTWEKNLYEKAIRKKSLDRRIKKCKLCPGLNIPRFTESAPGWGNLNADIFFIGQSLHKPGVASGLPFILGSGYLVDAALHLSGLTRNDVFISNVVHCHPADNRSSLDAEKKNCEAYLETEMSIVRPKLYVALGNDAKQFFSNHLPRDAKILYMKHPAALIHDGGDPKDKYSWIVKLSMQIDKALQGSSSHRKMVSGEQGFAGGGLPAQTANLAVEAKSRNQSTRVTKSGTANENLPPNSKTCKAFNKIKKETAMLERNKYKTIYIDPPWPETGGGKIKRGADKHYNVMSVAEIALYGNIINEIAQEKCHLYLWATNNYLRDAFNLLEQWNWEYITMITWMKDRKGLGQYYRGKTEHCLFARRGILPYRTKNGKRSQGVTGFESPRGVHSAKPEYMREMIELVSYPPRLEMFARHQYKGWDVWGNEV